MTVGTRSANSRAACSAASLLRPYIETGAGFSSSVRGLPMRAGPAAASELQTTRRGGRFWRASTEASIRVVSALPRR